MEKLQRQAVNKRTFYILWLLCVVGLWSILPYVHYLKLLPPDTSLVKMLFLSTLQGAAIYAIICWLSYKIIPKTDLQPFRHQKLKQIAYPAIIFGGLVGCAIFLLDKTVFHSALLTETPPPVWASALASIYGGVNEEVLLRLFLLTLVYFLLNKWVGKKLLALWISTISVALIFGLGHLPAAFAIMSPSGFEIFRILFLNGVAGVVFGWLYWSRGLWTAISAHFVADLIVHVLIK